MQEMLCPWESPWYLFFSSNVPDLVHYSHIVAVFAALSVGILIFINHPKDTFSRLFLLFTSLFSIWALLDVILWATNSPSVVMFSWSLQVLLESVIFALALYLFYFFLNHRAFSFKINFSIFSLLLPLIVFLPTLFTLKYLSLELCESTEGVMAGYYSYIVNIIFVGTIVLLGIKQIPKIDSRAERTTALYFCLGLIAFLCTFTLGNVLSSFTEDWTISQYGLFGMPIFVVLIGYSIVKFKAFDVKVAGAQLLVITLWLLVGSLLFVVTSFLARWTVGATLIFTTITGYFLVKGVKLEIARKEELEKLTQSLAIANDRLEELDKQKSEFISIASHQLRTPLTAIRGYISLALEGSYGPIKGTPMKDMLDKMYTIDLRLSQLVEDLLNVSKIEAGRVQYKWESVALEMITQELYDMFTVLAEKKGLKLHLIKPAEALPLMRLDMNKIKELLSNLIDNAIKYTEQGSVTIKVEQIDELARVTIQDTGIGIAKEDADHLFGKFIRTETTKKMDSGGSGLGLFIGRTFVEGHGGRVYATSDGEGKGSSFIVELPLVNPKAE